jgi:hypothetical protein
MAGQYIRAVQQGSMAGSRDRQCWWVAAKHLQCFSSAMSLYHQAAVLQSQGISSGGFGHHPPVNHLPNRQVHEVGRVPRPHQHLVQLLQSYVGVIRCLHIMCAAHKHCDTPDLTFWHSLGQRVDGPVSCCKRWP